MDHRPGRLMLPVILGLTALVGACAAAATPSPTPQKSATVAPSAAATPSPTPQETKKFTVGYATLSVSTVPVLAAADAMNAAGYQVFVPILSTAEMSVEGVSNGTFQFGAGSNSAALVGLQKGAAVRLIVDDLSMEWALYALTSIKACADLQGKKIGIFSAGGVSTALVKYYVKQNCPTVTPNYVVLGDSSTRAQALAVGQIDATPEELLDGLWLQSKYADKVRMMTSFHESLPNIKATSFYGNTDFMKQNPNTTKAFIEALLDQHRKINADWQYLKTIIVKYMPDVDKSTLDAAAKAYVDGHYFDVNGGLTTEAIQGTIDFFTGTGTLTAGLTAANASDLSYLAAAIAEIGKK